MKRSILTAVKIRENSHVIFLFRFALKVSLDINS